jgi:hypothetical protein
MRHAVVSTRELFNAQDNPTLRMDARYAILMHQLRDASYVPTEDDLRAAFEILPAPAATRLRDTVQSADAVDVIEAALVHGFGLTTPTPELQAGFRRVAALLLAREVATLTAQRATADARLARIHAAKTAPAARPSR